MFRILLNGKSIVCSSSSSTYRLCLYRIIASTEYYLKLARHFSNRQKYNFPEEMCQENKNSFTYKKTEKKLNRWHSIHQNVESRWKKRDGFFCTTFLFTVIIVTLYFDVLGNSSPILALIIIWYVQCLKNTGSTT